MKIRIRLVIILIVAGTALVVLLRLMGPEIALKQFSKSVDTALASHDEKSLYSLEASAMNMTRIHLTERQSRSLNLSLGRIQFGKAVFLPEEAGMRALYLDSAERYFKLAAGKNMDSAEALFWLGMCATRRDERGQSEAENYLIRSLKLGFPDSVKILKILNYIYLKKGEYDIIIRINEEFLKKHYLDPDIIYSLGKAYAEQGTYAKALPILALATNSFSTGNQLILRNVFFELGRCRFAMQDYATAASNFVKVLRLSQDGNSLLSKRASESYAISLFRLGDNRCAELLRTLVKSGCTNSEVLMLDRELQGK